MKSIEGIIELSEEVVKNIVGTMLPIPSIIIVSEETAKLVGNMKVIKFN